MESPGKFNRPFRAVCRVGGGRATAPFGADQESSSEFYSRRDRPDALSPACSRPFPPAARAAARAHACGVVAASSRLPGFAAGILPACRHSRSCSRRSPRSGPPVVRLFQCVALCEVGEDGADRSGLFDAGHDPHRAAAVDADSHVDETGVTIAPPVSTNPTKLLPRPGLAFSTADPLLA